MSLIGTFANDTKVEYKLASQRQGVFGVINVNYNQIWVLDDGRVIGAVSRPTKIEKETGRRLTRSDGTPVEGLPDTARFPVSGNAAGTVDLHQDLQLWMFDILHKNSNLSMIEAKNDWKKLMSGGSAESGKTARFFTDFAGSETNADYINGTNLDVSPMKAKPMGTGGTIVKIIGETTIAGMACYKIEAIDPTGNYRQYNPIEHWWMFFHPTNSVRKPLWDAKGGLTGYVEYVEEPFHWFNGTTLPIFGLAGQSYNFIQKSRTKILNATDELPSPYRQSLVPKAVTPYYPSPYSGA